MNRVIIMGSPRSNGRCAHLAEMLFEACIDECPEDELFLVPVSELAIEPCVGCGACRIFMPKPKAVGMPADSQSTAEDSDDTDSVTDHVIEGDTDVDTAAEHAAEGETDAYATAGNGPSRAQQAHAPLGQGVVEDDAADFPYCPRFDDDMQDVYPLLPAADELIIVAPVFFSGAPASLKALLDRLQPHFWAETRKAPKRSATLHVVGEGGDPYGYGPLVSEASSSLACAGFRLERTLDWVGKIDANGEITGEASEIALTDENKLVSIADIAGVSPAAAAAADTRKESRPKLDLSADKASKKHGRGNAVNKQQGRNPGKGPEAKGGSKGRGSNDRSNKRGQGGRSHGGAEAGRREKGAGHSQGRNRSGKPGNSKERR